MNYKELCNEILKETPKTGRSRVLQLERIKKLCEIQEDRKGRSNEYTILRKLSAEEIENKETYYSLIQSIIATALLSKDEIEMTNSELLILFGFIKKEFQVTRNYIDKVDMMEVYPAMTEEEDFQLRDFIDRTYDSLKATMLEQLSKLKDGAYIEIEEVYYLCKDTQQGFTNVRATDSDIEDIILPAKRSALNKLNIDVESQLGKSRFRFYYLVREYIRSNSEYDFYFIKKKILKNNKELLRLSNSRKRLNKKTIDRLMNSKYILNELYNEGFVECLIDLEYENECNIERDIKDRYYKGRD